METPARSDPAPALILSAPAGPSRRDHLLLGGLVAVILAALAWLDAQSAGAQPIALLVSGMLVYLFLCLARLEAAFALIVALTPFSMEIVFRGMGSALQIPTEPMLFVALGAWGLRFVSRRSTTFAQPLLTGALLSGLAACVISIYDTAHPSHAIKATVNALWYGLFGVFIWNNFADRGRLKALTTTWLVAGTLVAVYSLVNVAIGNFTPQAGYWYAWPFFTEHGTFAAYLSFVCMLALALAVEMDGLPKFVLSAVGFITGAQIVLSLTRGAWMGMAAGLAFLVVMSGRRLLRPGNVVLGVVGVAGLVVTLALSGAVHGIEKQTHNITDPSYVSNLERINRWYAGWNMFRSAPLTGIGYGTYADSYLAFRRVPLGTEQSTMHMGVHSEYLRVLSETGLIGVAACALSLLVLFGVARRAIRFTSPAIGGGRPGQPRGGDRLLRGVAVGMAGGLITYLVHGFVNNYLIYDKAAIPVWTAVGVLAAIESMAAQKERRG